MNCALPVLVFYDSLGHDASCPYIPEIDRRDACPTIDEKAAVTISILAVFEYLYLQ